MMSSFLRGCGLLLMAFAFSALVSPVSAQTAHVKVTLVVILAGEDAGEVDARLVPIADEVRKQNPQLRSFRLKSMSSQTLAENEKGEFNLIEGKKLDVVVKHAPDADNRVAVAVTPPEQGEIVYRSVCGKFLPIVTRYHTKGRDRLILALRVDAEK